MAIALQCVCHRNLIVADDQAGLRTKCPECGREHTVPDTPGTVPDVDVPVPVDEAFDSKTTSGRAVTSLVLGVSSWFCFPTGPFGLVYGIRGLREVRRGDGRVEGTGLAVSGIALSCIGMLIWGAYLTIGLGSAIKGARGSAQRIQCANNLKQIGLALHNFEAVHSALPPQAIVDEEGEPLLSWRVAILPYIGEQALYDEFHLDEPWDSEHNLALLP